MEVILSLDSAATTGGSQAILRSMQADTSKKILICPSGSLAEEATKFGKVILMNSPDSSKRIKQIRNLIVKEKATAIHIHGISALGIGILATIGISVERNYTEHLLTKEFTLQNKFRYFFQLFSYKLLASQLSKIYCVSQSVYNFLSDNLHIQKAKLELRYNPIPLFPATVSHHGNNKKVEIISVGSLSYIKNFESLLRIVKNIEDKSQVAVSIYGDGLEKKKLDELINELGLEKTVSLKGTVPNKSLYNDLLDADIYMQTSISESFGYAIAEAMEAGLPVIAYNVGGIPEIVQDGKTGFLIDPYNETDFTQKLEKLVKSSLLRKDMGKAARHAIEKFF